MPFQVTKVVGELELVSLMAAQMHEYLVVAHTSFCFAVNYTAF